jgi:hypothetical protein
MSGLARTTGTLVFVLLVAWSTAGWATSKPVASDARAMPPVNVEQLDLRTDRQTKDISQKRLRVRQVLLLWLLASQPAK